MFRLFCFNMHADSPKPKKATDSSVQPMQKTRQGFSQVSETKQLSRKSSLSSLLSEGQSHSEISRNGKDVIGPISLVQRWKSDEIRGECSVLSDVNLSRATALKKSQSDGIGVCNQGGILPKKHEMDLAYSSDFREHGELKLDGSKDKEVSPISQQQSTAQSATDQLSSVLVNESLFTIGDSQNSEDESPENYQTILSGEVRNQFGNRTPLNTPIMTKSCSLPMMGASTPRFGKRSSHSTSCEDLHILDTRKKDVLSYKVPTQEIEEVEDDEGYKTERKDNEYYNSLDGNDCCNYSALANGCLIPAMDEVNLTNNFHQDPTVISKEFKLARIEEWVNHLQHCGWEEEIKFSGGDDPQRSSTDQNESCPNGKVDLKASPGMDAAKKHISSLSASATMAQLANLGLVAIPILSAFVSLKVLNLSGNAIVRIPAGALPRGLHALNLSKNSISVIEGLRKLTRLRVLDLSYNRILRIGHGLASCSSLKELYLAGNKISEVEGLHRLLKLTVLDLGFNKISTAKCLGQLAANYNSLQAISLEGNPAQKNVGDDQLKKHLLGLLPNLVYFNRQPIKTSTLKDTADRAIRLGINAHQFERGLRSDNKALRKATRVASGPRPLSLSTYGRKSLVVSSTKPSRARHGNKASTNHYHNYFDLGNRLSSDLLIRKSRSAGNLGAL